MRSRPSSPCGNANLITGAEAIVLDALIDVYGAYVATPVSDAIGANTYLRSRSLDQFLRVPRGAARRRQYDPVASAAAQREVEIRLSRSAGEARSQSARLVARALRARLGDPRRGAGRCPVQ